MDHTSRIWLSEFSKWAVNLNNDDGAINCRHDAIFTVAKFLFSNLDSVPSLMSISLLTLEFGQF